MADIGKRIRQARLNADIVQESLAEQIEVSRTAIAKWESGKSMPTIDNLLRLVEVLGVSVDFLLGLRNMGDLRSLDLSPKAIDYLEMFVCEIKK